MYLATRSNKSWSGVTAFTLIELLVVVAIIATLISILLPSLNGARRAAKATKCAANLHGVGQAFAIYLAENNGTYPVAYLYPRATSGEYDLARQTSHPYGYLHWSYFLYGKGAVKPDAFTCPEFLRGGMPRTNPGPNSADWESGERQVDQTGGGPPGNILDWQAPRMAYTANAAIIPRNKFTVEAAQAGGYEGARRVNRYVRDCEVRESRGVILATEFNRNLPVVSVPQAGGGLLCKSHRSINPFGNLGANNEYAATTLARSFVYGKPGAPNYGLEPSAVVDKTPGVIEQTTGHFPINAVGRHHPGGDQWGGTTNFLYTDGRVARRTILQTMKQREWGTRFYSLTGDNTEVLPGQ